MSSELGFHNYNIYRYDRTTQTSMLSRGGADNRFSKISGNNPLRLELDKK
jgi:hypothetical protein